MNKLLEELVFVCFFSIVVGIMINPLLEILLGDARTTSTIGFIAICFSFVEIVNHIKRR